ncbi:MAG: hypothetical protein U9P72_10395 [Campylobacterota bacterium]|nr:hypothetical protein [Campylobacterota bacterium]
MNRINPLYIGVFLIIVISFISYKLIVVTDEYNKAKDDYKERLSLANELKSLKIVYADKDRIKKSLQKILRHSSLRDAKINQTKTKSSLKIDSKSMDMKALNFLMGKLLNGTYQIATIKIKKLSDLRVGLEMEIKW